MRRTHRHRVLQDDDLPRQTSTDLMSVGDEEGDPELASLEAQLDLADASPEEALASQPALFYRVSIRAARLRARYHSERRQQRLTEANIAATLKRAQEGRDDPLSDAAVAYRVRVHADVDAARKRANASRRAMLLAEALQRAYEQRHAALLILAGK